MGRTFIRPALIMAISTVLLTGLLPAAEQKLLAPGGDDGDAFGASVSLSTSFIEPDRALVGAPGYDSLPSEYNGIAYFLDKVSGVWTVVESVTSQTESNWDRCGLAVKLNFDEAWVGVPGRGNANLFEPGIGGVVKLRHDGATWSVEGYETPSGVLSLDAEFGSDVDIWGSYGVVGAPTADRSGTDSGAAFIYRDTGSYWEYQGELKGAGVAAGDFFGSCVAIYSDWAMAGAPGDWTVGDEGSVYVFKRDGTNWVQTQKITAGVGDSFGGAMALSGSWLAVGAPYNTQYGGRVYLYENVADSWELRDELVASDGLVFLSFGFSLAMWDANLVVGAPYSFRYGTDSGAVYLFRRFGTQWQELGWRVPQDAAPDEIFGYSVAVFQNTVMVGAPNDDNIGGDEAGAVYLYEYADFQNHIFSDGFEVANYEGTHAWSATVP
jgi:hypothetical protein